MILVHAIWGNSGHVTDLELHAAELVEDFTHVVTDDRPCDAVIALRRCLNNMARHIVERDHVLQHPDRLVERTEPADRTKRSHNRPICTRLLSNLGSARPVI